MNLRLSSKFSLKLNSTSRFLQNHDLRSLHNKPKDCVLHSYKKKVDAGLIRGDPHQAEIISELNKLANNVIENKRKAQSWALLDEPLPQGIYMYGGVGTGKTMLMDIFVDALDRRRSRTHFNQFMLDVQQRLHAARSHGAFASHANGANGIAGSKESLMGAIVKDLLQNSPIVCFDEFQVLHIADAMLLQRLFSLIWEQGAIVIATSNRPPEDLYKNGLQRQLFLPFIAQLKQRCKVLKIKSDTDYRLTGDRLLHVYQSKRDKEERKKAIDEIWESMDAFHDDFSYCLLFSFSYVHLFVS
jgi:predicted ATPase